MYYNNLMNNREKILKYIKNEIVTKGIPPTIREICDEVGLKSTSSVQYHLNILEEDGLIQRDKSKSRSIKFDNFDNNSIPIPIVGEIAAGHPLLTEEYNTGTLHIPNKYETNNEIFALKISGDSMIDAGIFDKDLVVVEKNINYKNNDIVAVMINNEATVKFYKKIDNNPYLIPANKNYKKMKVTNDHEIIGKVVCLFRDI